jgi:hypothetical protein
MSEIKDIIECTCGAITVFFGQNGNSSMFRETAEKMNLDLSRLGEKNKFYNCNHCVNHWGIDLCLCGSGESPEECECGCRQAAQEYGTMKEFTGWVRG